MKNLKIAGLVVGLHAFAVILIFVNPGCSSTSKPAPVAADTAPKADAPGPIAMTSTVTPPAPEPGAPVAYAPDPGSAVHYSPTRPGTPVATALETPPVTDVTPATTYVVVKGDTLITIAHRHHLTTTELRAANNLKAGSTLRLGQKLMIPAKAGAPAAGPAPTAEVAAAPAAPAAPMGPPPAAPADATKHTIKPGETLGSIARHYGVKVGDIATANNISDPKKIRPGQELIIPAKSATGPKGSKAAKPKAAASAAAAPAATTPAAGEAAPGAGQDLDAGLKAAPPADVPVVKVEDGSASPPK